MPFYESRYNPDRYNKFHQRNRPRTKYDWKSLKEWHPEAFKFWKKKLNKSESFFA